MEKGELIYTIEDALLDVLDGNTDRIVETMLDAVAKALQRDTRSPHLTAGEYDLLFADAANAARESLRGYWEIDTENAAQDIAEAVIEAASDQNDTNERREKVS